MKGTLKLRNILEAVSISLDSGIWSEKLILAANGDFIEETTSVNRWLIFRFAEPEDNAIGLFVTRRTEGLRIMMETFLKL